MAVAPHHLASQSALAVLREGGSAIEAMVAAAATIAVVYPHMNGLGGDGFWLIVPPRAIPSPLTPAARRGRWRRRRPTPASRRSPPRPAGGPDRGGHRQRLGRSAEGFAGVNRKSLPLTRLLEDAIGYAAGGIPVTASQASATADKFSELRDQPGFAETFLVDGQPPKAGSRFCSRRWRTPCAD
jgi:gamma-glutamyltranspeptidase/glutathione hydrolase